MPRRRELGRLLNEGLTCSAGGEITFLADLVDERWPLEMINNPLWKEYVCKPDPAMRRMAWKIAHKMEFCATAWPRDSQSGAAPLNRVSNQQRRHPNNLSFPEKA